MGDEWKKFLHFISILKTAIFEKKILCWDEVSEWVCKMHEKCSHLVGNKNHLKSINIPYLDKKMRLEKRIFPFTQFNFFVEWHIIETSASCFLWSSVRELFFHAITASFIISQLENSHSVDFSSETNNCTVNLLNFSMGQCWTFHKAENVEKLQDKRWMKDNVLISVWENARQLIVF